MRNGFIFGLVAILAVFAMGESVQAGGNNNNGGKNKNRGKVCIENKDHDSTYAIWIRGKKDRWPSNFRQLKKKLIYCDPYSTVKSKNLKNGSYEIYIVKADFLPGKEYDREPVDSGQLEDLVSGYEEFEVEGYDVGYCIESGELYRDYDMEHEDEHGNLPQSR